MLINKDHSEFGSKDFFNPYKYIFFLILVFVGICIIPGQLEVKCNKSQSQIWLVKPLNI